MRSQPRARSPLGKRLRQERDQRGMSLRELARRLDVSPSLVSQIETGKVQPSVRTLYAMVSELGVSLDEMFVPEQGAQAPAPESDVMLAALGSALSARGRTAPSEREPVPSGSRVQRRHDRSGDRSRVGRSLGAAHHVERRGRRLPLHDLRGRRRLLSAGRARPAQRPRVRDRHSGPPRRHGRLRGAHARAGRLRLVRVDRSAPAAQRRGRGRARDLVVLGRHHTA